LGREQFKNGDRHFRMPKAKSKSKSSAGYIMRISHSQRARMEQLWKTTVIPQFGSRADAWG
jgi:hypothetical protein